MSGQTAFDFDGRHVLVTGGTSGIGLAIACGFAEAGATVDAVGLDPPAGLEPDRLAFVAADITSPAALDRIVPGLERLDAVVSCAGIIRRGDEHDPEVFARVLDVNLTGTMRTFAACRPLLEASRGVAVAVAMASMLSFVGGPLVPGYSASKGGVVGLVKSLANAWAPSIRVNAIAPGWIATPLTASRTREDGDATILARTLLGRWGEPEDLIDPTLFLCSESARFITGVVMRVDGGYLAA